MLEVPVPWSAPRSATNLKSAASNPEAHEVLGAGSENEEGTFLALAACHVLRLPECPSLER